MLRALVASLSLLTLVGCNVDVDALKDCKDKNGKPLPEWMCRKNAETEAPSNGN